MFYITIGYRLGYSEADMSDAVRRERGEGSIYQRADGMWVGALPLTDSLDGKRRRKVVYGKSETEARANLKAARRDNLRNGDSPTNVPTVAAWADEYLKRCEQDGTHAASTLKGHHEKVRNYIVPAIGKVKLDRVTAAHVRKVHALARADGRSPTTAYQAHMVLSGLLTAARSDKLIRDNPCRDMKAPPKAYFEGTALSAPDSIRLLDWAEGDPWHDLRVSLALLTGPRSGEALGLTRGALHLERGTLDYTWQLQRLVPGTEPPMTRPRKHVTGNYWLIELKRGSARRDVPLMPRAHQLLEQRLNEMDAEGCTDPMELIFTAARGGPMSHERDWSLWKAALAGAGVRDIRRHDSRHTTATLLREAGVDERVIQSILGHTSGAMTAHYSHLNERERTDAVRLLGGLLERQIEP